MTIRFANTDDIPRLLNLLRQVERVHHDIRPDLFRDGGEKYEPETLKELLKDVNRPVLAAVEDGVVVGYAFCVLEETAGDPARLDRKELYLDDRGCLRPGQGRGKAAVAGNGRPGKTAGLRCRDPERLGGQRPGAEILRKLRPDRSENISGISPVRRHYANQKSDL